MINHLNYNGVQEARELLEELSVQRAREQEPLDENRPLQRLDVHDPD